MLFFLYTYSIFFSALLWHKRRRAAVICLILWMGVLVYMLNRIVRYNMALVDNDINQAFSILPWHSFLVQIVIASIMVWLARRVNRIQEEKEKVLADSVERLTALNTLKEKYSQQLQNEVEQRTQQLNLSNRQLAQQADQLKALDIAKSRFFAGVSHEFRTPLTLILGKHNDLLSGSYGALSDPVNEALTLSMRQSKNILELVEELLDIAKLESGAMQLTGQQTDLVDLIGNVVDQLDSLATSKSIRLERKFCRTVAPVVADPKQFRKVIINLIGNALKYTPSSGHVIAEIDELKGNWLINIRDNGPGIPKEETERIFERFHQHRPEWQLPSDGVGLGLPLAKEIVELHNGELNVTSEVGKGSCFTLTLPQNTGITVAAVKQCDNRESVEPDLQANSAGHGEGCPSSKTTVLVVEDNNDLRRYITDHLKLSYRVLQASNGQQGYNMACKHLPDLIISDVMMPVMDGINLCKTLKANDDTDFIPLILLTALSEEEHQIEGLSAKADDYLCKPFSSELLKARVNNLIMSRRKLLADSQKAQNLFPAAPQLINRDQQFVLRFEQAVSQGLSNPEFSVDHLAQMLAIERSTLFRKVRAVFNASPSELIAKARLTWAQELLRSEEGTITDIAFTVGYGSVAHFSHSFKKAFAMTPSAYRKHHRASAVNN